MSQVEHHSCLLEGHWLDPSSDLVVVVAHGDGSLSENHIDALSNGAVSLVFELGVDGKGNLCLRELVVANLVLLVVEKDGVTGAILEPE